MPNVSEYSQCQPDCVIYHNKSVQKTKILAVTVQTDISESDSDSNVNIEDLVLTNSMGCTVEVKSGSVSNAAINECYFNIFGCASRLSTIQLQMGNIVQAVNIYGVVVSMEDPSHAVLLSLSMNFGNGSCM